MLNKNVIYTGGNSFIIGFFIIGIGCFILTIFISLVFYLFWAKKNDKWPFNDNTSNSNTSTSNTSNSNTCIMGPEVTADDCTEECDTLTQTIIQESEIESQPCPEQSTYVCYPGDGLCSSNFPNSSILTDETDTLLKTWVTTRINPKTGEPLTDSDTLWKLCYSSTIHPKDDPSEWHTRCDGYNQTVIVGRNQLGYTFGGYTGSPWGVDSSGREPEFGGIWTTENTGQFLFRLDGPEGDNPDISGPEVFDITNQNTFYQYSQSTFWPTFGSITWGYDLIFGKEGTLGENLAACSPGSTYQNENLESVSPDDICGGGMKAVTGPRGGEGRTGIKKGSWGDTEMEIWYADTPQPRINYIEEEEELIPECVCAPISYAIPEGTSTQMESHTGCGRGISLPRSQLVDGIDRDWCDTLDPTCIGRSGMRGTEYCSIAGQIDAVSVHEENERLEQTRIIEENNENLARIKENYGLPSDATISDIRDAIRAFNVNHQLNSECIMERSEDCLSIDPHNTADVDICNNVINDGTFETCELDKRCIYKPAISANERPCPDGFTCTFGFSGNTCRE